MMNLGNNKKYCKLCVRVYFVSPDGNDENSGKITKPWRTIQKAANTIKAGNTVYIREGVYNERVVVKNSGSPHKYITFAAYPGETAVIDGSGLNWNNTYGGLIDLNWKSNIRLIGLEIYNSPAQGIGTYWSSNPTSVANILIKDCNINNSTSSAILIQRGTNITIDGCVVNTACSNSSNECISILHVDGFEVKNNQVLNSIKEGIDIKCGCTNGKVYNNEVSGTVLGIYLDAWADTEQNIEVYNNIVHNNSDSGIAVASEKGGLLKNIKIHNNLSYENDWGFTTGDWGVSGYTHAIEDIYFYNNTLYNNSEGEFFICSDQATNIVVVNNIFGHCTGIYSKPICLRSGSSTSGYNIDYNFLDKIVSGQPTGTNYLVGDPLFVDPATYNFALQSGSPAINAGIDYWSGEVCNMGAY